MFICPHDGRHFRGFIADQAYVAGVLARLEGLASAETTEVDAVDGVVYQGPSKTNLEQANSPITENQNDGRPA